MVGHLDGSHNLAIVNNAAMTIEVHTSFSISVFIFFECTPTSEIAIFNILGELPNCCLHQFTFLPTVQEGSVSSTSLLALVFLMVVILKPVKQYLSVAFICISPVVSDVDQLFISLFAICMSSL